MSQLRMKTTITRTVCAFAVLTSALVVVTGASGRSAAAPVNTVEPFITGVPLVGNNLTGNRGTWTGATSYTYQWLRCDETGADCVSIAGATTTTYKLITADAGAALRFRATAKNADGSTSKDSNGTSVVATESGIPLNSRPPTISGSATVGSTLTAAVGNWVGTAPITYSFAWQRCDADGNACKPISGATKSTFEVVKGLVGDTLRIEVTAKNSRGSGNALSANTTVVQDAAAGGGVIALPGGGKSISVQDVPKGERLIVEKVVFSPNPVSSRTKPITVTVTVTDTRGYFVRDAYVFIRSTPILTLAVEDQPTGTDGRITYSVMPRYDFPLKTGYSVQFFVKAYRLGDNPLAGVSGTRLVQVATVTP